MIKQRIKKWVTNNNQRVLVGYLIADTLLDNPDFVSIGISICHPTDKFDREVGELLAYQRINKYDTNIVIKDKYRYYEIQFDHFLSRCRRYFKDKNVIVPKIFFIQ